MRFLSSLSQMVLPSIINARKNYYCCSFYTKPFGNYKAYLRNNSTVSTSAWLRRKIARLWGHSGLGA